MHSFCSVQNCSLVHQFPCQCIFCFVLFLLFAVGGDGGFGFVCFWDGGGGIYLFVCEMKYCRIWIDRIFNISPLTVLLKENLSKLIYITKLRVEVQNCHMFKNNNCNLNLFTSFDTFNYICSTTFIKPTSLQ